MHKLNQASSTTQLLAPLAHAPPPLSLSPSMSITKSCPMHKIPLTCQHPSSQIRTHAPFWNLVYKNGTLTGMWGQCTLCCPFSHVHEQLRTCTHLGNSVASSSCTTLTTAAYTTSGCWTNSTSSSAGATTHPTSKISNTYLMQCKPT